eukprot:9409515-Pyramimonas_sp.AAC.1
MDWRWLTWTRTAGMFQAQRQMLGTCSVWGLLGMEPERARLTRHGYPCTARERTMGHASKICL